MQWSRGVVGCDK